jgi:hypothetical protein
MFAKQSHTFFEISERSVQSVSSSVVVVSNVNVEKIHAIDSKSRSMALPLSVPPCHVLCCVVPKLDLW